MVKDPIRSHGATVGGATLEAATGRPREEWFAELDAAGATGWDHPTIARWLVQEHGVDGWWAQSLTVGYEQERGLRLPGQRPGGTFEAGVSKTLPLGVEQAFAWFDDADLRRRWLDVEVEVRGSTPGKSVRWRWPDGTRVTVAFLAAPNGRTRVGVTHAGLPDSAALADAKSSWTERLSALHGAVAG